MRRRPCFRASVGLVAVLAHACASVPAQPVPPPRPSGTGEVEVTVHGLADRKGQVLVALFLGGEGWPGDQTRAFATAVLPIEGTSVSTRFDGVPAGPFAVSVFHDENGDRKLDTGLFGVPSEGYGFSRDARGTFGPPSFDDARIELDSGETKAIAIEVK
jgi:uncharacterized protein (DUF2141 family)